LRLTSHMRLIRITLPEVEDSARLQRWLRDAMTGYLQVALGVGNPYAVVAPTLAALIRTSGGHRVVDLASGGGGPWPRLLEDVTKELGSSPAVTLTDVQPNLTAAPELERLPGVSYRREPMSALAVSPDLDGVRTMFTGLHHFDETEVTAVLRAAQDARVPFLAAEATHRSFRGLAVSLLIPLLVVLLMPQVRPRRLLPLLLTYLPPLLPILIWWDGFASTLKTYRVEELRALTEAITEPGYAWRVDEITVRGAPIPVTVIVGVPSEAPRPSPS
jgi:hypothetical protein